MSREPARDVVARSLDANAVYVLETPTHRHHALLYLAVEIDRLYEATEKLLQLAQMLVQHAAEQGQGTAANGTNTAISGGTPSKSA